MKITYLLLIAVLFLAYGLFTMRNLDNWTRFQTSTTPDGTKVYMMDHDKRKPLEHFSYIMTYGGAVLLIGGLLISTKNKIQIK